MPRDTVIEQLKEIFKNEKNVEVSKITKLGVGGVQKTTYTIKNVCEIPVENNEKLQEIIKNYEIEFENCRHSGDLTINDFKNLSFKNCKIEMFDCRKSNSNIKENLSFKNCVFYSNYYNIDFNPTSYKNVSFERCIFKSKIQMRKAEFENFNLQDCVIGGEFGAEKSIFKGIANFKKTKFGVRANPQKTVDLSEVIFYDNAYFDECKFNHFTTFHSATFKKTASFYEANFNVFPNFSPGDFQGILNFNNIRYGDKSIYKFSNFDTVKNNIENAYRGDDFLKNAINFRDSFRGIKHKLLENGNSIDALNYGKMELYCREIELVYSMNKDENLRSDFNKNLYSFKIFDLFNPKIATIIIAIISLISFFAMWCCFKISFKNSLAFVLILGILLYGIYYGVILLLSLIQNIKIFPTILKLKLPDFTQWFEYASLYLYRNTSDHHTNLNKIFHFTLLMIAGYGVSLYFTGLIHNFVLDYALYTILSLLLILVILIICSFFYKNINVMSGYAIMFLLLIFMFISLISPHNYATFGVLFYVVMLFVLYGWFISKNAYAVFFVKIFTYIGVCFVLFSNPTLIKPILNIFDKENLENRNLSKKLNQLDYTTIANLAKLSFKDYENETDIKFDATNITNQKKLILENKFVLEEILGFLFASNSKEILDEILKSLGEPKKLEQILQNNKNRVAALNLIFTANKQYVRKSYDMEIVDDVRIEFKMADKAEIKKEIDMLVDIFTKHKDDFEKLKWIIDDRDIYYDIYKTIKLDKITDETHKSTYILYMIVMILCLYSLTKQLEKILRFEVKQMW